MSSPAQRISFFIGIAPGTLQNAVPRVPAARIFEPEQSSTNLTAPYLHLSDRGALCQLYSIIIGRNVIGVSNVTLCSENPNLMPSIPVAVGRQRDLFRIDSMVEYARYETGRQNYRYSVLSWRDATMNIRFADEERKTGRHPTRGGNPINGVPPSGDYGMDTAASEIRRQCRRFNAKKGPQALFRYHTLS